MRYRVNPAFEPLGGASDWDGLRLRGTRVLYRDFIFGGDEPTPPTPDPAIGQAAQISAEVAREQLAYTKQRDAELQPLFEKIINAQTGSMEDNRARATEQWDRYREKGIPMEDTYFSEASNFGTEADQAVQAGRAMQDVSRQFDIQDAASKRDMARYGVNPASGRFNGTQRTLDLAKTAGMAAAGTNARNSTRMLGMSMRENAAKFARGLPTTGIAADSLALSGAAGAGGTAGTQANIHNAGTAAALSANRDTANILTGQFNQQQTAYNNAQTANRDAWSGLGTIAGAALGGLTGGPAGALQGAQVGRSLFSEGGEVRPAAQVARLCHSGKAQHHSADLGLRAWRRGEWLRDRDQRFHPGHDRR